MTQELKKLIKYFELISEEEFQHNREKFYKTIRLDNDAKSKAKYYYVRTKKNRDINEFNQFVKKKYQIDEKLNLVPLMIYKKFINIKINYLLIFIPIFGLITYLLFFKKKTKMFKRISSNKESKKQKLFAIKENSILFERNEYIPRFFYFLICFISIVINILPVVELCLYKKISRKHQLTIKKSVFSEDEIKRLKHLIKNINSDYDKLSGLTLSIDKKIENQSKKAVLNKTIFLLFGK